MHIKPKILVVENDVDCQKLYKALLQPHFDIWITDIKDSHLIFKQANFDSVVTNGITRKDNRLRMDGFSLLRYARSQGNVVPFIFLVEGQDGLLSYEADTYGAFEILHKGLPDFHSRLLNSLSVASDFHAYQCEIRQSDHDICKKLCSIPHVTAIQWNYNDANLYETFFEIDGKRNKYCYANSWAYICQAARTNGHKFFDGKSLITIQAKKNDDELAFEIIRPLGQMGAKKAFDLAVKLKAFSKQPIVFKRLEPDQFQSLKNRDCKLLVAPSSGRLEDCFDDIHPQVIIDLHSFFSNVNIPEMAWFRKGLRQFTRRNYTIKNLKPYLFNDVKEVLLRWKRSFIARYRKKKEFQVIPTAQSYYFDPYLPFVEHFGHLEENKKKIATIFYVDHRPVGFSFMARVSDDCMALYANVADTSYNGLSNFMLYHNFSRAFWMGYSHVNLGGTEAKSLHDFYLRLTGNILEDTIDHSISLSWKDLQVGDLLEVVKDIKNTIRENKRRRKEPFNQKEVEKDLTSMKLSSFLHKMSAKQDNLRFDSNPVPRNMIIESKYLYL